MLTLKHPAFEKPVRTSFLCAREDTELWGWRRRWHEVRGSCCTWVTSVWWEGANNLEQWERVRHRPKGLCELKYKIYNHERSLCLFPCRSLDEINWYWHQVKLTIALNFQLSSSRFLIFPNLWLIYLQLKEIRRILMTTEWVLSKWKKGLYLTLCKNDYMIEQPIKPLAQSEVYRNRTFNHTEVAFSIHYAKVPRS